MRPKPVKTPGLRYSVAAALPSYTSVTYDRQLLDKTVHENRTNGLAADTTSEMDIVLT